MNSLDRLLVTGLEHLYGAHQQGAQQAAANAKSSTYPKLKAAVEAGSKLNLLQARRLEKVFKALDREPTARPDAGMQGIAEANETLLTGTLDPAERDLINIALGQTAAHFYMAKYGTLRTYAELMGNQKATRLLQKTLDETVKIDRTLTTLAREVIKKEGVSKAKTGGDGTKLALLLGIATAMLAVLVSRSGTMKRSGSSRL